MVRPWEYLFVGDRVRSVFSPAHAMTISGFVVFGVMVTPVLARAPLVAPEPPRKAVVTEDSQNETREVLDASSTIDAAKAREMLMQQLLRAAEAGIVDMQSPEGLDDATRAAPDEPTLPDQPAQSAEAGDQTLELETEEATEPSDSASGSEVQLEESNDVSAQEITDLANRIRVSGGAPPLPTPPQLEVAQQVATTPMAEETVPVFPAKCFSRTQLTLPDIIAGQHLAHLIGEQRKALIGEFDAANPEPAIALAKTYLAAGMVHEAKVVVREFALGHPLGQMLLDIADVWLGEEIAISSSLLKEDCIGVQALWRAYAQARREEPEQALRSEISSGAALEELPLHVRQVVASELGMVAAQHGQWDSARRLSAMANRAAAGEGQMLGATHLLAYRLAKWRDDDIEAKTHLASASSSDPDTATKALLIRAEEALLSDDVLSPSHGALRMDLGALARREVGSDVARRAFELEAKLFHRSAGTDDTIDFLSDAVELGLLDQESHPAFLSELISKPAYSETARPLSHIYLEDPSRFDDAIEQSALRRSLVRSLAEEGVPGVANRLLRDDDLKDPSVAVQLAQSFVDVDEYRAAIAILSKADDGISQRLILSKAFLGMGDFEKAISALREIPENIEMTPADASKVSAARLDAELAGRDFASAYATTEEQLTQQSDQELAVQSALFALENGASEIPAAARKILAGADSDDLKMLEEIYSLNLPGLDQFDQGVDGLMKLLDEIESGEGAIMEMIENG